MNDTQNLLAFVYKNASMGTQTLPQIAEKTDGDFRTAVENRLARYEDIKKSAGKLLTCHKDKCVILSILTRRPFRK